MEIKVDFEVYYISKEYFQQIFEYLEENDIIKCSLVCKCWNEVAIQNYLWEKFIKSPVQKISIIEYKYKNPINEGYIHRIIKYFREEDIIKEYIEKHQKIISYKNIYHKQYLETKKKKSIKKRTLIVVSLGLLYMIIIFSFLYKLTLNIEADVSNLSPYYVLYRYIIYLIPHKLLLYLAKYYLFFYLFTVFLVIPNFQIFFKIRGRVFGVLEKYYIFKLLEEIKNYFVY
jgi:hypothetical protein